MKVAVCLCGYIRTWEHTKRNFMKIFCKDVEVDLFVHTYFQNYYEYSSRKENVIYSEEEIIDMFDGMNLKDIIIEDRNIILPGIIKDSDKYKDIKNFSNTIRDSSDPNSQSLDNGVRIYDQFRKIELCNNLRKEYEKENNVEYDIVVKTRFDILYFRSPNWESLKDGQLHTEKGTTAGYPPDGVIFGTPEVMDKAFFTRWSELELLMRSPILPGGNCNCGNILP